MAKRLKSCLFGRCLGHMNDIQENWKKLLSSQVLKDNLIAISLFLTTFELFKKKVIDMTELFYSDGFDENNEYIINNEEYTEAVTSKNKSKIYAALLWFKELNAIDSDDIDKFDSIRKHRNELAHNIFEFVSDAKKNLDFSKFSCLLDLLFKIEKWWVINFELPLNPSLKYTELDLDNIITGSQWQLRLLFDIASGNEPEEDFYLNKILEKCGQN